MATFLKLNFKYFLVISIGLWSCSREPYKLQTSFVQSAVPTAPDYAEIKNWAVFPGKRSLAQSLPKGITLDTNLNANKVDIFFVHPTIFTFEPKDEYQWNANLNDTSLNKTVDKTSILNQVSVFNGLGKIYAPRYRQAHYFSFVTQNKQEATSALDLAYQDVRSAFDYYLKNHNAGRPIVLAGHSQGSFHLKRLIKEFFDDKPLKSQLVVAYLIGMQIQPDSFKEIKPSEKSNDLGTFVSWNTFSKGYYPPYYKNGYETAVCTNPLSWKTDEVYVGYDKNKGGVGPKFNFLPALIDAQCENGLLWIGKPKVRGAALIKTKIWHRADINLFWMNLRENAALRIKTKLNEQ